MSTIVNVTYEGFAKIQNDVEYTNWRLLCTNLLTPFDWIPSHFCISHSLPTRHLHRFKMIIENM